jgi:5-methylcytosine-specific restriction endonuclease McrA
VLGNITDNEDMTLKCDICRSTENITKHHIIKKSKGGITAPWNIMFVCRHCHDKIHETEREYDKR